MSTELSFRNSNILASTFQGGQTNDVPPHSGWEALKRMLKRFELDKL